MREFSRFLAGLMLAVVGGAEDASAGPWARGAGTSFLSFSATVEAPHGDFEDDLPDPNSALFFERGLTDRLTFGIDAFQTGQGGYASVLLFLRKTYEPDRFAGPVGLTVGLSHWARPGRGDEAALHLGLSWGRGGLFGFENSWATLEASTAWGLDSGGQEAKLDGTVGMRVRGEDLAYFQVQNSQDRRGTFHSRAALSYVYSINAALSLELGVTAGLHNVEATGAKVGMWVAF